MFKIITLGLLAAATIASPAMAATADAGAERTIAVRFSDLDMTSDSGQQELQRRIEVAARDVCGMSERPTGSFTPSSSSRSCYVRALNAVEPQVQARAGGSEQRLAALQ